MSKKLVNIIFNVTITITLVTNIFFTMPAYADEAGDTALANESGFTVLKENDAGDAVILLQLRLADLGYFNYKITNFFGEYTKRALAEFQQINKLSSDGVLGEETYNLLYSNAAKRRPVEEVVKTPPKSNPSSSSMPKAHLRNWFGYVNKIFTRGETAKVYDVDTGITYNVTMVGGYNHADIEPTTAEDTRKLLETYGGEWSWERRAVIVKIDGEWIAGSTNGQPHGYETVSGNNMDGQVCIHFVGSKTHGTGVVDKEHQAMIQKAYDVSN